MLAALVLTGCEPTDDIGPDGVIRDLDGQALDADDRDADDDDDDGSDVDELDADDADDAADDDADVDAAELDAADGDADADAAELDAADGDADDGEDSPRRWDVETSGLAFVPSYLEIRAGDSVRFDLGDDHDAVEVDEATWTANGSTPKAGGFSVGFGQKVEVPFPVAGTYHYVCTPHVDFGMKGRIVVKP
jgi:plastocyanin